MDWEQIRDNTNAANYEALMKVLAEKLHAQQLLLVATVAHGWGGEFYNVRSLKYADWIQLMAYDQAGPGRPALMEIIPAFSMCWMPLISGNVKATSKSSQMVIGLPFLWL